MRNFFATLDLISTRVKMAERARNCPRSTASVDRHCDLKAVGRENKRRRAER